MKQVVEATLGDRRQRIRVLWPSEDSRGLSDDASEDAVSAKRSGIGT